MIRLTTVFTLMLLAGAGLSSCSASRKTSAAAATTTTTTTKTPEIVKAPESGPVSKHQMLIGKNASASAAQ